MLKVIDLFSGAGGLSLGFEQAGFRITKAVENNKWAQETYRQNHHKDIELFDDIVGLSFQNDEADIVIGGPPCQGFSNANRNRSSFLNSNNLLIKEYFRVINEVSPKMFVMENVSSILSETHLFFVTNNESGYFRKLGINLQEKVVNLSDREEQIEFFSGYIDLHTIEKLLFNYKFPKQIVSILKTLNKKTEKEKIVYLSQNKAKLLKALSLIKSDFDNLFYVYLSQLSQVLEQEKRGDAVNQLVQSILDYQNTIEFMELLIKQNLLFEFEFETFSVKLYSYTVKDYINKIVSENYHLQSIILDASQYGIPQKRKRFFLIGHSKKFFNNNGPFDFSKYTDTSFDIGDAIKDLELLPVSFDVKSSPIKLEEVSNLNAYVNELRDSSILFNHVITESRGEAVERFKYLKPGQNFHDLPDELKSSYSNIERTQNTIYQRLDYAEKSGTVVNVRKSMWIHPCLDRAISIREAARLQSFPDSFIFCGSKDSQYQQVGNAVPPKLARMIAECCKGSLTELS